MKIFYGLLLCFPLLANAASTPVTPDSLQASIAKNGAASTISSLNEKDFGKLNEGIANAAPDWLALVPKLAPAMEGGNADAIVEAMARGLAKNPVAVLNSVSTPEMSGWTGRDALCSMPFPDDDETSLTRYYRQTEPALKKLGKPVASCLNQLDQAFAELRNNAQSRQKYSLNRKTLTPALLWQALDKDGVEKVASTLSTKQRQFIGESISQGDREWLLIADTLAPASNPQTHAMLLTSLASALTVNPGETLKAAGGHFDTELLCAMPFPEASNKTLTGYYQKTRTALLKIRRRGEACLKVLDDEYATMLKSASGQ